MPGAGWIGLRLLGGRAQQGRDQARGAQPQQAIGQVASGARETVTQVASGARETVTSVASGARETVTQVASGATDRIGRAVGGAQDVLTTVATGTPRAVGEVTDRVTLQAQRASNGAQRVVQERPLAVAAAAVATGAVAALLVPTTRREQELMGTARETIVERVDGIAEQAVDRLEQTIEQQGSGQTERAGEPQTQPAQLQPGQTS